MSNNGWSRTAFISYFSEKGFYFSHCQRQQRQQQQQRWFNPLHRWPVVIAWLKATLISVVMTKRIGFEERPLRRMNCYSRESNTKPRYMCYHSDGDRHSLDFDFWETAVKGESAQRNQHRVHIQKSAHPFRFITESRHQKYFILLPLTLVDVSLNASLILPSLLELTFTGAKSSQLLLRNPIIPSARCKTQIKPSIRLANAVPIGVINQAWLGLLAFYQGERCHFKVREHTVAFFRWCFFSLSQQACFQKKDPLCFFV